jgi:hypothetical protein
MFTLLALFWFQAPTATTEASAAPVPVPHGRAIELGGKLAADEWQDAARHAFANGGELLLKHDGARVYVGVRGGQPGLVHLYLCAAADAAELRVHHASAALGTAIYDSSS